MREQNIGRIIVASQITWADINDRFDPAMTLVCDSFRRPLWQEDVSSAANHNNGSCRPLFSSLSMSAPDSYQSTL